MNIWNLEMSWFGARSAMAVSGLFASMILASVAGGQANLADVIERCERSVVRIEVRTQDGKGLGSGFVIGRRTIATNVHVLLGAQEATAVFPNGKKYSVIGTLKYDSSRDIAIARIEGPDVDDLPLLPLTTAAARKGQQVVALGSPLGLSFTATSGVVSAIRDGSEITRELGSETVEGQTHQGKWIQLDAALSPGNSGGPVINGEGEVVAMSTLASQGAQNLNFGISSQDITAVISSVSFTGPVTALANGVGKMRHKESSRSSEDNLVETKKIPVEAIQSYVNTGRTEFKSLKRDLEKEIVRLRSMLKEMRAGEARIPPGIQTEADIIRAEGTKRGAKVWFFRSEAIKRAVIATLENQMKDLTKVSLSTTDAQDKNSLLTLLGKYGPALDTRMAGTVGFLPSATVLHAFNGHEALILIDDVPYIIIMPSTAGLSRGEEIIPSPVYVSGTTTARLPGGRTTAVTVLQSVSNDELKEAIFGKGSSDAAGSTTVASAPTSSGSAAASGAGGDSGYRTWYDRSGSFSVEAVLLQVNDKEVVLRKRDGKTVRVPRGSLSEADQRYLRQ